ncbi:MAG: dual specificity protein phosphatase family protein [Armatimonadetes bacterium]|nr:dual specificity protein phosphatase family protein [Armatimonadota bacterium]
MHHTLQRPFPRSYWVVPELFLAGFFPGASSPAETEEHGRALLRCGIRQIINLMEADERDRTGKLFTPYGPAFCQLAAEATTELHCQRMPIPDFSVPSPEQMSAILTQIDTAIAASRPLYLHCLGGKGRTGTVVGCWLVRHGKAAGDEAIALLNQLRVGQDSQAHIPAPETEVQRQMIRTWQPGQ